MQNSFSLSDLETPAVLLDEARLNANLQGMQQLADKQKACVDLFYLQGKSYKEIASLRNEGVGKIRSYIQNGRRNLKNCIEQKMKEGIETNEIDQEP